LLRQRARWDRDALRIRLMTYGELGFFHRLERLSDTFQRLDFIVFDRYIYDQLAALPMQSWWARAFARVLLRVAPKPDLSYVLDADPEVARARKPEYPLEFMRKYRSSYLELRKMANLQLIQPGDVEQVHGAIVDYFRECAMQKELDSPVHSTVAA